MARPDWFILDHGSGTIKVETDDKSGLYREGYLLRNGDRVSVTGRVYRDGKGPSHIEARRVYNPLLDLSVFASPADEEGAPRRVAERASSSS